jgi:hypothetical protein
MASEELSKEDSAIVEDSDEEDLKKPEGPPLQVEGEATYEKRGLARVKAEMVDFVRGYRMT